MHMNRCLFASALLAVSLCFASGKFVERPLEKKIQVPGLSFALTFDNRHVNADFAAGNRISLNHRNLNLALRGTLGFDDRQGYTALPGEELKYSALNNIDPHNGSISLWINARDFNPRKDEGRGNMVIYSHQLSDGKRWINLLLYEFRGQIWADWRNSTAGSCCSAAVISSMTEIRSGEFFQLVYTWKDSNRIALYLNGREIISKQLPLASSKTADLKIDDSKSYISFRPNILSDSKKQALDLDDIMIFRRALTPLEVANWYAGHLQPQYQKKNTLKHFSVQLHGVDRGHARGLDEMLAEIDLSGFTPEQRKKGIAMNYALKEPDGTTRKGQKIFTEDNSTLLFRNVRKAGNYLLTLKHGNESCRTGILRPDLSFIGNGIGDEDVVPELWKDFRIQGRRVTLWNRIYQFDSSPFPRSILVRNQELLTKMPMLVINGRTVTDWQKGPSKQKNTQVVYTGRGKFPGGSLSYRTTVEFDGFIRCDFTIHGRPSIRQMHLTWQVARPFLQYLMVPELYQKTRRDAAFNINYDEDRASQLWFASEKKGGFAWAFEHDANWIYKPEEKILKADCRSGVCRIDMISHPVRLAADATPYHALFIATPVRPLPARIRNLRTGENEPGPRLLHGMSGVFTGPTSLEPDPVHFPRKMAAARPGEFAANGLANSMSVLDPVAVYFEKFACRPGATGYNLPFGTWQNGKLKIIHARTVSACNNSSYINDLYLWNIRKLFQAPYNDRIAQIYYDLCSNAICTSRLHGCRFQDSFGRWINTCSIISMRRLILRTVRYAHAHGRTVFLHGQRDFHPMLQGTADYWFPGEEQTALFMRNPYGLTDEVPDAILRSEFNRNVRGTGIIVAPMVHFQNAYKYTKPSEAFMGTMLLFDLEVYCWGHINTKVLHKINSIMSRNQCDDRAVPHLFYEQKEIISSHPDLRCTWYECPGDKLLIVVMNKEPRSRKGRLDASKLTGFTGTVRDEYFDVPITGSNGIFDLKVPARSFRLFSVKKN